MKSSVSTEA
ncbi:hypothetical protein BDFB_012217 [Asbolus verrucosus]|uniref:Uncharacterized protein n=1 Tax=Asbolus verrucosus TaxID=1661398 RepID=A0A482VZY5_ASBVE|nr:hypothetical protein BDFB_012217 [Asbolus verrucosus]